MRQITAALTNAQKVRAPRCRSTITVSNLGTGPDLPAVEWTELVANTGQSTFKKTGAVGLADGTILRFVRQSSSNIEQQTIDDPTSAAAWTSPSATATILTHDVYGLFPIRYAATSIRLFYIHGGNGNVLYIDSTDDGATWGSPVTIYSGGDATNDLVACYNTQASIANGPWFVGFSIFSGGAYTPKFGYDASGWTFTAYSAGWRSAGLDAFGTDEDEIRCLVFRPQDLGPSRLRQVDLLNGSYSSAIDIDQTQGAPFGIELAFFRFHQLTEHDAMLGVACESAQGSGAYLGVCSTFHHVDQLIDEPIIFPSIVTTSAESYFDVCQDASNNLYLVGDTAVHIGTAQSATSETLTPIRYTLDNHTLIAEFSAVNFPTVLPGQLLTLTRTITSARYSGSEDLAFAVVRTETVLHYEARRHNEPAHKVILTALDPVGFLGMARSRRPSIINDGNAAGAATLMRRIAAKFGQKLYNDTTALESDAVTPMTLQPAESLAGAAYRAANQSNFYLVPKNDGTWELSMIDPPDSNSGDYDDTAHAYGATDAQPLIQATALSDSRRLTFAYILGTHSTDPEDGGSIAMAAGPVVANTRPISFSLTNNRYNTSTRVSNAASAEAARQKKLNVDAIIHTWPNLALEQYDMVAVTEPTLGWDAKSFRVRHIVERYEKGELRQELHLGVEL